MDEISITNQASNKGQTQTDTEKDQTNSNATINTNASESNTQIKPSKREGNQQGHDITGMQAAKQTWFPPTQATTTKPSRRTTSLLNLFMSNPPGM